VFYDQDKPVSTKRAGEGNLTVMGRDNLRTRSCLNR
jgi:hypothetical protein